MGSGFVTGGSAACGAGSAVRGTSGGTATSSKLGAEVEPGAGWPRVPDAPSPAAATPSAAGAPVLTPGRTPGVAYRPDGTRTFLPENTASMTHGARSRFVAVEARELADEIMAAAPHLTALDRMAVEELAVASVKVRRLGAWLEEVGDLDENGEPRTALTELRRWMDRAGKARARLGLDPVSRAALAVDELTARRQVAALNEQQAAKGRRLVEAAEAQGFLTDTDDDSEVES